MNLRVSALSLRLVLVLGLPLCLATPAAFSANVLDIVYATTFASPYNLNTIDQTTGVPATVYANYPPGGSGSAAVAQRGSDGMIFYITGTAGNDRVYRWDPNTPAVAPVFLGTTGASVAYLPRLAFGQNEVLYAINTAGTNLYTISQTTGAGTSIATYTNPPSGGGDFTFTPDGTLLLVTGSNLWEMPLAGGAAINRGAITGGTGNFVGMAYNARGESVIINDANPASVYTLNTTTRVATRIGAAGAAGTAYGDLASAPAQYIRGKVFEDVNYGGGAGRSDAAASGVGRPNARVELFDGGGNFVIATVTDASGNYELAGTANHAFIVRVVGSSVTSSRTGAIAGLLPIPTFRTNAASGTAVAVLDRVGGEIPNLADAGNGSTTLAALTTATTTAQSISSVTTGSAFGGTIANMDFGFNFDTVVNANASGPGSLAQVITNTNPLSNAGLAQVGYTAGTENVIFMISNGSAAPGFRAANNYFIGGIATVAPVAPMPTVSDPLILDATLQPGYAGTPLLQLNGTGAGAGANGLTISGGNSRVTGLVINRFNGSAISLTTAGNNVIAGSYLGTDPAGTAASANAQHGVDLVSGNGNTIGGTTAALRNIISGNTGSGLNLRSGVTTTTVIGNFIGVAVGGSSALGNGTGITLTAANNNTIGGVAAGAGNVIASNAARGINLVSGTGNAFVRNAIFTNINLGIDLGGNAVSPNDGVLNGAQPNGGMDYPIFTQSTLSGATLTLAGFVGSAPGQSAFASATIEIFKADNVPADQNGQAVAGDGLNLPHGEGRTYLGTITADASGNFNTTLAVSGLAAGESITATARNAANNTSEFSPNALVTAPGGISGNVFEDVNYGGGAGRTQAAASGVALVGARLELYDAVGNFVNFTTTDASGNYAFSNLAPANYTARVVNGTVISSRTGYVAGLLPIQTFRTDASTGTAVAVTDRVGGEVPNKVDAGNGSTTLAALTTAATTAQSITPVTVGPAAITGANFGFNFDTMVNVNDTGQGSLRQFVNNANALANAGLAQSGLVAGKDNAVFMISNGTAAAGLRAANNYFVGGIATVTPASALPTIADPIVIDGTKQPGWTAAPIIELTGTSAGAGANGLSITAGASVVRGLIVNRFLGSGILLSSSGGNTIQGNYLGTNSAGTAASQNDQQGLYLSGSPNNLIGGTTTAARNVISGNRLRGLTIDGAGATGNTISGNYIGVNAIGTGAVPNIIGVYINDAPGNIIGGTAAGAGNVISGNSQIGLYFVSSNSTGNSAQGNVIGLNASASGPVPNGTRGVEFVTGASNNTLGGAAAGAANIIAANAGGGVRIIVGTGNRIQRNSIYGNSGAGLDLGLDNVTGNNGAVGGGPNNGMDYAIFTAAQLGGGTLNVNGYVGSAPGQAAFANATIEIFKADNVPADQNGETVLGDGQNVPHGEGRTYLGTVIANASGNFNASLAVGGLAIGDTITATATNAANDTSEFGPNFVVTIVGVAVSGTVYNDTNHNAQLDTSETGTGLTLFAKLISASSPTGPATQAVAVDLVTGAYSFGIVAAGEYIIVLDNNNTLADVTPTLPAGWIGTERPDQTRTGVVVSSVPLPNQTFGLYNGAKITGTVFLDTGVGGGTANDGVQNGAEAGIAETKVRLTDNSGAVTLDETTTDGAGQYVLWAPAPSALVKVVEVNPSAHLSTGASLGTSGGSYDRATDTITFTQTPGTIYTALNFGDVPSNTLNTEGQQAGLPGTTIFYPHTFTAGTTGSVVFSSAQTQTPAFPGWTATLYRDTNANGQFDAGEPAITGPITVATGEVLFVIVKISIPVNASFGAGDSATLSADFTYTGATPALAAALTRKDFTTVGNPTTTGLRLSKAVDKPSALPGSSITYTITYTNASSASLGNVIIYDTTPAFTTFLSAANGPLPPDLTGVVLSAPAVGATGAMRWTFSGTLGPGATGTVSFTVKLDQ